MDGVARAAVQSGAAVAVAAMAQEKAIVMEAATTSVVRRMAELLRVSKEEGYVAVAQDC